MAEKSSCSWQAIFVSPRERLSLTAGARVGGGAEPGKVTIVRVLMIPRCCLFRPRRGASHSNGRDPP